MSTPRFRMGRLDHAHVRVPNREEAARWYGEHLGFERVERFAFWAEGFEGGPLQISADGGRTMLALFEATESHPMVAQTQGIAFSVDADTFMAFARALPNGIPGGAGRPLEAGDLIDFDLCWAFDLADPWGNRYELNCYEYERIRKELVEADGLRPERYWPRELFSEHGRRGALVPVPRTRESNGGEAGIRARLTAVMQDAAVGLTVIAACADAVAADARFNLHVATVEKRSASDERMVELLEAYESLTHECVCGIAAFRGEADTTAFLRTLEAVTRRLEGAIASR